MRHRFAARRALLLAVAAACALPALAPAAPSTIPVPAEAPTVATSPSGAAVIAWIPSDKRLCTAVQPAGAARPTEIPDALDSPAGGPAGSCVPMPAAAELDAETVGTTVIAPDRHMTWGWTGTGAAIVELRRRGALFGTAGPATPSPLPGVAAYLRFFALEHPAGPLVGDEVPDPTAAVHPDELVLRDAFGVVRRASELRAPRSTRGPALQRGRHGKATWTLFPAVSRELAPTPLDPERRETRRCLQFNYDVGDESGIASWDTCDGDPEERPYLLHVAGDCWSGQRLEILVREPARRAVAILGDGRRRTVPLAALSPGTRAGMLLLGTGVGVRRILALSAAGRTLATQPMGLPPQPRRGCLPSRGYYGSASSTPPPLPAGAHALRVTDRGARICVALDHAPRAPEECALPPMDPHLARLAVRSTTTGRVIHGVVPSEIAAVRATRSDGSTRTVAATPIAGYTGRYAAALRQVVVALRGASPVTDLAFLDARGRTLQESIWPEDIPLRHVRTLLRAPGAPPLRVGQFFISPEEDTASCVWLDAQSPCAAAIVARERPAGILSTHVEARCAPARIAILAVLRRRADRLVVRTASGREVTARRVRVPAGSGPGSGLYAHLAVLGPHDGVKTIIQRGRAPRALQVPLPPASRQCGYTVAPGLDVGTD